MRLQRSSTCEVTLSLAVALCSGCGSMPLEAPCADGYERCGVGCEPAGSCGASDADSSFDAGPSSTLKPDAAVGPDAAEVADAAALDAGPASGDASVAADAAAADASGASDASAALDASAGEDASAGDASPRDSGGADASGGMDAASTSDASTSPDGSSPDAASGDGGAGNTAGALEAFCEQRRLATYSRGGECSNDYAVEAVPKILASLWYRLGECADLAVRLTRGQVVFDASRSAACLQAIAAMSCEDAINGAEPQACKGVVEGSRALGQSCYEDGDCAGAANCQGSGMAGPMFPASCSPGTCVADLPEGADCTGGIPCVDDCFCVEESGRFVCRSRLTAGASCSFSSDCPNLYGTYCRYDSPPGGTCVPRTSAGEACSDWDECAIGLECAPYPPEPGSTCRVTKKKLGEPCSGDAQDCLDGLYCDGVCRLGAGPDEPCGLVDGAIVDCAVGQCDSVEGLPGYVCKLPGPLGYLHVGETCPVFETGLRCEAGNSCLAIPSGGVCGTCPSLDAIGTGFVLTSGSYRIEDVVLVNDGCEAGGNPFSASHPMQVSGATLVLFADFMAPPVGTYGANQLSAYREEEYRYPFDCVERTFKQVVGTVTGDDRFTATMTFRNTIVSGSECTPEALGYAVPCESVIRFRATKVPGT